MGKSEFRSKKEEETGKNKQSTNRAVPPPAPLPAGQRNNSNRATHVFKSSMWPSCTRYKFVFVPLPPSSVHPAAILFTATKQSSGDRHRHRPIPPHHRSSLKFHPS